MNKSLIMGVTFAVLSASFAFAADLPIVRKSQTIAPPTPPPPFTWTGFYVGLNGGYSWGSWDDGIGDSLHPNGGIAGGTIGFNYQINQFVVGIEGDIDWSGMKDTLAGGVVATGLGGPATGSLSLSYKDEVLSTLAARFGLAFGRSLVYAKVGGAWADEKFNTSGTITIPPTVTISEADSFSRFGWIVGGGVEYAVTNNLTVKAEYNYLDFGNRNNNLNFSFSGVPAIIPLTSHLNANVLKVGVNILFN